MRLARLSEEIQVRERKLARLSEEIRFEDSPQEKQRLRDERKRLRDAPSPQMPVFTPSPPSRVGPRSGFTSSSMGATVSAAESEAPAAEEPAAEPACQ